MKLEMVGKTGPINLKEQTASNLIQMPDKGDILICEVEDKQGDGILFRNNSGSFFAAKLLADITINVGDSVEMIVSDIVNEQYIVKVIDILPREKAPEINQRTDSELLRQDLANTKEPSLALSDNAQLLPAALSILKKNPDIALRLALFLAANNISASSENVQALTQIIRGDAKPAALLIEIMSELKIQNESAGAKQAVKNAVPDSKSQILPRQDLSSDKQLKNNAFVQPPEILTTEKDANTTANPAQQQPEILLTEKETNSMASLVQQQSEMLPIEKDNNTTVNPSLQEYDDIGMFKMDSDDTYENIAEKILSIFYKLNKENKGAQIRNNVLEMPAKLKELKLFLNHNDIKGKETYIKKVEQLEQQIKIMSQVKRVACFQIPIYIKSDTTNTAELYVYQYKKKKENKDTDNFLILVGLDTEHAGRIEVTIKADSKNVALKFGLENDKVLEAVKDKEKSLSQAIEKAGFHLAEIETHILLEKTTVANAADMLPREAGRIYENLDVRV